MTTKSARARALAAYVRHLARQHRTRDYVLVRQGSRTLAVYRVKPGGDLSRLKRWPKALARPLASHGTPLATTSV